MFIWNCPSASTKRFWAKVDVPTLDGRRTLTIPPETSSGAKLRIKAHGIQRGEEKGDQIVVTKVVVPKKLDDEDRKSIEHLAQKHPESPRGCGMVIGEHPPQRQVDMGIHRLPGAVLHFADDGDQGLSPPRPRRL